MSQIQADRTRLEVAMYFNYTTYTSSNGSHFLPLGPKCPEHRFCACVVLVCLDVFGYVGYNRVCLSIFTSHWVY